MSVTRVEVCRSGCTCERGRCLAGRVVARNKTKVDGDAFAINHRRFIGRYSRTASSKEELLILTGRSKKKSDYVGDRLAGIGTRSELVTASGKWGATQFLNVRTNHRPPGRYYFISSDGLFFYYFFVFIYFTIGKPNRVR